MEKKYYTPKIEEFHVGFEFESRWNNNSWEKHTWKLDSFLCLIGHGEYDFSNYGELRVKYLDRADIESFEFEYLRESPYGGIGVFKRTLVKDNATTTYIITSGGVTKFQVSVRFEGGYSVTRDEVQFTINNKAEFKKLLEMLNIANE